MLDYLSRFAAPAFFVLTASILLPLVTQASDLDKPMRSGNEVIADYSDAVKTESGKEVRKIKVVYNWDEGATYTYIYDKSGKQTDSHVVYGPPTPSEAELEEALAIVEDHAEVKAIKRRQAGIAIDGGFPFEASSGHCARPARCLQMFLFDAENVVRQMLVDMRTRTVVDSDYIPPQNKEIR